MFGFLKRKKTYPAYVELPIPEGCREMTEYEKRFVVNGGSERRENSHEGVAGANVGDTIERKDGTVVTLNQGDIDYAKAQLGISDSGSGTSVSGSVGGSGSSVGGSGVGSSGSPADTAPKVDLQKKPQIDHQRNTELMDGWYENSYISHIEKNKKNVIGGKKVEEKEINVNQGAGNMTVSDYIAKQRKKGAGATLPGQAVEVKKIEGQAADGNSSGETVDPRNRGFPLSTENYPNAYGLDKKTKVWIVRNDDGLGNEFNATRYIYKDGKLVYQDVVGANCAPSKTKVGFTTPDGIYYLSNEILYHQEDGTSNSESYKNVLSLMTRDSNIPEAIRDEINIGDRLFHSDEKYDAATGTLKPYSVNNYPYGAGCIISDSQEAHDKMMSVLMDGVSNPESIPVRIVSLSNIPGFYK